MSDSEKPTTTSEPTEEELEDVLLSCRYGESEEVESFVEKYGITPLVDARDERGSSALHMCCGNGHLDILNHLLPLVPATLLSATNEAGSPPIHWAIINNHVEIVKSLVAWPEDRGGGLPLLKQKNSNGRDAFMESIFAGEGKEEVSGWIEGYLYKVEGGDDEGEGEDIKVSAGDQVVEEEAQAVDDLTEKTDGLKVKEQE